MPAAAAAASASALPEGYVLSDDAGRLDVARVHRWLSEDSYWALGRPLEKLEQAIAGSLNFGVYEAGSGEQVAFARVVTDRATFAWLCDVYVSRDVRGRGVGVGMVREIRARLDAYGLRRVLLATQDAHGVYAKVGFRELETGGRWMVAGSD